MGEFRRLAWVQRLVGIRPVLGRVVPLVFGPDLPTDPRGAAVIGEWARRLARTDRAGLRRAVLGVADRAPVQDEIGAIAVPTLVVVGAQDRATPPEKARDIVARVPGARLQIVGRCGHTSPLEQPATITGLVAEFLDQPRRAR